MAPDTSLGEALCLFNLFCEMPINPTNPSVSSASSQVAPSSTLDRQSQVQDQSALITSPPELRLRNALPAPQNGDSCQQAEQSASQAIQQATQQASQSIQQASQQASQAIQQASQQLTQSAAQASRSASQGIQQAQQSASQSIADAQRSVSSAISALSSVQASAASEIAQVNGQMESAKISASAAQSVASAVVAAATGSVAAAGSSFLAAAAKATQGAQASVSSLDAAAASQVAQASLQASASQTQAVTATQVALAIVGSIIASALITILIYFLIIRHKKKANRRSRAQRDLGPEYSSDPKFPISDQVGTTIAASQSNNSPAAGSHSSDFHPTTLPREDSMLRKPAIKTSTVPWNPAHPPKAPRLTSWLKLQDGLSPFGPISLSTDANAALPLGGQLKSPHRTVENAPNPLFKFKIALRSPTVPVVIQNNPAVAVVQIPPKRRPTIREPASPPPESLVVGGDSYRENKASVWTDETAINKPSPALQSPPPAPKQPWTLAGKFSMQTRPLANPRSTAEWLAERALNRDSLDSNTNQRPSYRSGLPQNPKSSRTIPSVLGPHRNAESMLVEAGYVQGLNPFLESDRGSMRSRVESGSSQATPGFGKAM